MDTVNTDLLRGRVDIIVLNALSEKDGYGYDILNYIQTRTQGHYEMKQSSVYSVLKRLEKSGYISSYSGGDETNGAKRRYYTLTDSGRDVLENEKKEWSYTRTLLDNLVTHQDFDLKTDTPPFQPSDLRPLTKRISVATESATEETETNEALTADNFTDQPVVTEKVMPSNTGTNTIDNNSAANSLTEKAKAESAATIDKTDVIAAEKANSSGTVWDNTAKLSTGSTSAASGTVNNRPRSTLAQIFGDFPTENAIFPKETAVNKKSELDKEYKKPLEKQNVNQYKDVLGSIFNAESKNIVEQESADSIDCKYIYDLKAVLKNEGYRLKEYSPMQTKSSIKYISFNKLLRDSLFLTFLFYIMNILVLFLTKTYFEISSSSLYILGGLGLIIPIAALLIYYQNPNKKKKDSINLKLILNVALIVYLGAFMINLIVALLVPNEYSLNSLHIYAPCFIMLIIPFFGIIISLLHKSQKYHLS